MNGISLIIFLLFHLSLNATALVAESQEASHDINCPSVMKAVVSRGDDLRQISSCLSTLINGGGKGDVIVKAEKEGSQELLHLLSIADLFQFELSDEQQIAQRVGYLVEEGNANDIFSSSQFQQYRQCAKSSADKDLIHSLAELQAEVNIKRLKFLRLSGAERNDLLAIYIRSFNRTEVKGDLDQRMIESQRVIREAQAKLQKVELKTEVQGGDKAQIQASEIDLEEYLINLEKEQVVFIQSIRSQADRVSGLRTNLEKIVAVKGEMEAIELSRNLEDVAQIWRAAVDRLLNLYFTQNENNILPVPEQVKLNLPTSAEDEVVRSYQTYIERRNEVQVRQNELVKGRAKMLEQLKAQTFRLLVDAGASRSWLLEKCDLHQCERARGVSEANVRDMVRELRVVPLKLLSGVLTKWIEIKAKFFSGLDGWLDIGRQIIVLVILLLIPFALVSSLNWVSRKLDAWRRDLVTRSLLDYRYRTGIALWIVRLNPFVPFIGMIVSIEVAQSLLYGTDFSELAKLLYYLKLYFIYRVVRLLLGVIFEVIFATTSMSDLKDQGLRIEQSAMRISRLIFIEFGLLHITEDSVRRALAYHLFANLIFWINVIFCFMETYRWRVEITHSFNFRFPILRGRLQFLEAKSWSFLLYPLYFVGVVINDLAVLGTRYLVRMDLVKWVLSEVLRKKLERTDHERPPVEEIPPSYLQAFDYYQAAEGEIYIDRRESVTQASFTMIQSWIERRTNDDLLILVGNRGMGKTTVLNHIFKNLEGIDAREVDVKDKILEEADVFQWLSEVFQAQIHSVSDVLKLDRERKEPLVIGVDNMQNFFLAQIGGFEAYRIFQEVINLRTSHVFWCLTVNSRSWDYLKGVFGEEHFYGKTMKLAAWKDFEIQDLISVRHNASGFKRRFDDSIKAYGAGDAVGQQAETQFFRLLWGQSRGNPRSALMYWMSAISYEGGDLINVGVPSFINSSLVATLSDESLFIMAAISRHDSLTDSELKQVTGIESAVIRKCLKEAQDKKLIWVDQDGRMRISSKAQYVVDYYLIGKNFLYE